MTLKKLPHLFKSYPFCKSQFKSDLFHEALLDHYNPYFWHCDGILSLTKLWVLGMGNFVLLGSRLTWKPLSLNP